MARTTYGGTVEDIILTPVVLGGVQVAGLPASQQFQVWNLALTTQYTDIQDGTGIALPSGIVVSTPQGGIPEFRGPDGISDSLRLKHVTSGTSWIVRPASYSGGSGGASLPNTLVVAASGSGITGDYNCDGTADDVEINAALTALRAGAGGTVVLTAGTFNIASPVLILGFDDVDVEQDLYLRGQGPKNTTLAVTPSVSCGIRLANCVRAHISDLGLTIDGSSDGIQAVAPTAPAAGHRSAWLSTLARIQVLGPFDGGDTGWAFDLDNVFRASMYDIEVNGTTNGIRWQSTNGAFNPGDAVMSRCFVDIGSGRNGGAAYAFESTAGQVNQLTALCCHGIGSPSATGQVCWKFIGSTAHIRTIDCNAEQFATTVSVASAAYDIDVDLVHVTLRNGSTLVDFDGYGSKVRCGLAYVEPSATVTLVDDDNGYSAKPNIFGPVSVYAETGSTVNADVDTTLSLRDVTWDGPGTIATAVKQPTLVIPTKVTALTDAATIAVNAALGNHFRVTTTANRALGTPTNPTDGQRIIVEHIASGGARTLSLTTGVAGSFQFASAGLTALTATASGTTDFIEFVYSATLQRWRIVSVSKG
jgi:hypothetical protein